MQINYRDNGFFGKGIYSTTHAEHACRYATGEIQGRPRPRANMAPIGS